MLYGAFVWARMALNRPFRRFLARAVANPNVGRDGVGVGINSIAILEKQLLNMIGNLV
jgi:hypothetical protein